MQTFDQALLDHVQAGRVTMEEAMKAATTPARLQAAGRRRGRRATTMATRSPRRRRAGAPWTRATGAATVSPRRTRRPGRPAPATAARRRRPSRRATARRRGSIRRRATDGPRIRRGRRLVLTGSRDANSKRLRLPRKDDRRADDPRPVQRDQVAGRLRAAELQAAEGSPRPGHDPGQARLDGRLPGRGRRSSTPARAA